MNLRPKRWIHSIYDSCKKYGRKFQSEKFLILGFFLIMLFCSNCLGDRFLFNLVPKAHSGVINLNTVDWEETDQVRLEGEWKFYWKKFLSELDPLDSYTYIQVPGYWNDVMVNGERLPPMGYATYSLEVYLPEDIQNLGIYCLDASTSYRVFWNGELVIHSGKVARNEKEYQPDYKSYIGDLNKVYKKNTLLFEVANFRHHKGGAWESIIIGKKEKLVRSRLFDSFLHVFAMGCFWIMALYQVGLYSSKKRDPAELFFGLFSFFMGFRFLFINDRIIYFFFPNLPWELGARLDYLSAYLSAPFFVLLIHRLFTRYFSKIILRIYIVYSLILILFILFVPYYYATMTNVPFQAGLILIFLYIFKVYVQAILRGFQSAVIAFLGMMTLFLSIVNDVLHLNLILQTGNYAVFGLLVFIFSHALMLSKRLSKAFITAEKLALNLKKSNSSLRHLKEELEVKIQERTKELMHERTRAEMIGRMTSEIVHDLKNPIAAIMGFSEMANLDDIGKDARMEYLEIIQSESVRLADMSQGILDYVRGGTRVERARVNLEEFFYEVFKILKPEFRNAEILFQLDLIEKGSFSFDKELIRRVILNIAINAIQAMLNFGREEKKFILSVDKKDSTLLMYFTDNGPGIPTEIQDKIYEPFVSYGKKNGTGLGMALAKEIVESHQGQISFETKQGEGTKFIISIPEEEQND
jgi:signal transduction histidine kinase